MVELGHRHLRIVGRAGSIILAGVYSLNALDILNRHTLNACYTWCWESTREKFAFSQQQIFV